VLDKIAYEQRVDHGDDYIYLKSITSPKDLVQYFKKHFSINDAIACFPWASSHIYFVNPPVDALNRDTSRYNGTKWINCKHHKA